MSSDLFSSYLVLTAPTNLRETVRATSADTLYSETDDHLREAISTSGHRETSSSNRKANCSTKSGLSNLSETDGVVRADLPEARLLRAYVSKIDVPRAQGVFEEIRTTGYSSNSETSNFIPHSVPSAESGAGSGATDQCCEARATRCTSAAYLPLVHKTVLPLRDIREQMSRCDCSDRVDRTYSSLENVLKKRKTPRNSSSIETIISRLSLTCHNDQRSQA